MHHRRFRLRLLLLLLVVAPAGGAIAQGFTFAAFGDMPYRAEDEPRVHTLAQAINQRRPDFAIFLGDTKNSREVCNDTTIIERPHRIFARFERALIYTPGDNEWTDCLPRRDDGSGYGPAAALSRRRESFWHGPSSLGGRPIALRRQGGGRDPHAAFTENASWVHRRVAFATLNLPGEARPDLPGARQLPAEAQALLGLVVAAGAAWIDESFARAHRERAQAIVLAFQANIWHPCNMKRDPACARRPLETGAAEGSRFVEGLALDYARILDRTAAGAAAFRGPVLLLHGDTHRLIVQPAPSDGRGGVIRNATRVMVPGEDEITALLIRVRPGAGTQFAVVRLDAP
jgi:hypothetical protein